MSDENQPLVVKTTTATPPPPTTSGSSTIIIIPVWLRVTTNAMSLLSVFLFSGIIFGWAPMELILLREGQYNEVCYSSTSNDEEAEAITNSTTATSIQQDDTDDAGLSQIPCPNQMIRLQVMFTVGQFLLSFMSLPVGWFLDHAPKPLHYVATGTIEIAGLILFSISDSKTFDQFVLGYGLMSFGGCMTMLGAFPSSFLLPSHQAGILASISCLFDASSVVFFVMHRIDLNYGYNRKQMFALLAGIAIMVYTSLIVCWYLLEKRKWKQVLEDDKQKLAQAAAQQQQQHQTSYNGPDNDNAGENHKHKHHHHHHHHDNNAESHHHHHHHHHHHDNPLHKLPVKSQLMTTEYLLATTFASVHMLRCNYYIMTVDDYLRIYLGDTTGYYANIFSFILPCGIVFVPVIEYTITKFGVLKTLQLTNMLGVLFGAILLVPSLLIQAIDFGIFACFRAYLYATLNTFIAVSFGVETMGRIIGCVFTTASIVSLLQYPTAVYAAAGNWLNANWIMLSICAIPVLLAIIFKETAAPVGLPARSSPSLLNSPGKHLTSSMRNSAILRAGQLMHDLESISVSSE